MNKGVLRIFNGWLVIVLLCFISNKATGNIVSRNGSYFAAVYFDMSSKKSILSVIDTYTGDPISDFEGIYFNCSPHFYFDQRKGREFLLALGEDLYFYSVDFAKKWTYRISEFTLGDILPAIQPKMIGIDDSGAHFLVGASINNDSDNSQQEVVFVISRMTGKVVNKYENSTLRTDGKTIIASKEGRFVVSDPITGMVLKKSAVFPFTKGHSYSSRDMELFATYVSQTMNDPDIPAQDISKYKEGVFKVYDGSSGDLLSLIGAKKEMGSEFMEFCPGGDMVIFGSSELLLYNRNTDKLTTIGKASKERLFVMSTPHFSENGKVMLITEGPSRYLLYELLSEEVKQIGDYQIGI